MPGIVGFIGKDLASLKCVLSIEGASVIEMKRRLGGWGAVYYRSGDLLLKSHPHSVGDAQALLDVLREAQTDLLLGRFESAATPQPGKWNMQPFRYRGWAYVQQGKVEGFNRIREHLVGAMPDFLGRSLRGNSDAEGIFHLVLSFLYDAGKLDDPNLDTSTLVAAMKHSLEYVRKMCAEHGGGPPSVSLLMSNGALLAGYNANQEGRMSLHEGRGRCKECDFVEECKLYRYAASTRSALVMSFRRFPESFDKKRFTVLQADTFFTITKDITVESIPGRISLY